MTSVSIDLAAQVQARAGIWVSGLSTLIAAVALAVAFSNRKTSRRALQLGEAQEQRRQARLTLKMEEAVSWRAPDGTYRGIAVRTLAVNPTDRGGSIIGVDLQVTYTTAAGHTLVVKIPHGPRGAVVPTEVVPVEIPVDLPANGAAAGWFVFRVDDGLIEDAVVDRYDVVVHDSRGPVETMQPWAMRQSTDG